MGKKIPVLNLFPAEIKTYTKDRRIEWVMQAIVFLVIISLFAIAYLLLSNASEETQTQYGGMIIVIAVSLLVFLILWNARKKIFTFILSFMLLIATYLAEGYILYWLGIISQPFSWGIVSLILITAFAYWFGTDIDKEDILKLMLLCIVAYLLNASGWMEQANSTISGLFSGLFSKIGG